jgi:dipeptidyl aminopeptidase/acylaminoacyl peptidase
MSAPRFLRLAALVLLAHLPLAALAQPEAPGKGKTLLRVEDLYRFDHVETPTLAPDGKHLAYIRHWIDRDTRQDRFSLWVVEGRAEDARPREAGEPDARSPVFSPDGKWIAFLSTRPRPAGWKQTQPVPPESDPAVDVWLIPTQGGPAIPLAGPEKPYNRVFNDGFYGRLSFSPEGRRLAFIADKDEERTPEEISADVVIVRPDQGEGYTGYGPAQIWVAHLDDKVDFAAHRVDRLRKDDVWYGDPQWSPDGRSLVVHANRTADRESVRYSINKNFDLWQIDAQTGADRQLTSGIGPEVSPRFSADGKHIACLSIPRKGSHRDVFNLAIVTLGPGGPRTEIVFDHHGPGSDKAPCPPPSFPLPLDCWDGDHLVYQAAVGTTTQTIRIDPQTGKGGPVPQSEKDDKADLATFSGRSALRARLTPPGNAFLRDRVVAPARVIRWKNDQNQEIEVLLTLPPESVGKPPYPLLLNPHGGPHGRSMDSFNFTVQVFAARGYAVFQPNYRGSDGYGQRFLEADRHDFGGGDVRDILTGIDHLVAEKLIDPDRQFVYGSSYGGFLTTWLVGHTNQFRAAVAQNAVTDMDVFWGLGDLKSWVEWDVGGRPWEAPGELRRHSPLTYAASVKTPTLILHSRDDRRCPMAGGRMFYEALRARRVPTQMVIYPGEGHAIRQPRHQEDVLRRVLAWFEKYDRK